MAQHVDPFHWRATAALLLLVACDSTGPGRERTTFAALFASATFVEAASGQSSDCLLSGSWVLPAWPVASRTDSVTLHFARQFVSATAATILRDTLLTDMVVTWTRIDSTHLSVQIGPPLTSTMVGALDSASGRSLTATWRCPPTFPLGADSALLINGYQPDSLQPGPLMIDRLSPID